jgi:hypothetical protein
VSGSERPAPPDVIMPMPAYLLIEQVVTVTADDPKVARAILEGSGMIKRLGSRKGPRMVVTERLQNEMPEVYRKVLALRLHAIEGGREA